MKRAKLDTRCSICGLPQFLTPSGVVCRNGHGGVDALERPVEDLVVGVDQSARGTAAVALRAGVLAGKLFWADGKRAAKELAGDGALAPVEVKAGDEEGRVRRLAGIRDELRKFLLNWRPAALALEDYALARQAFAHELGEVGGVVRLLALDLGIPFRVYDVQTVKIFATGDGGAEKAEVVLACRDGWEGLNFLAFGKSSGAAGNLADAYVIAQLLRTELRLRTGTLCLEDLEERERRVFVRTTKQRPTNLLELPLVGGTGK